MSAENYEKNGIRKGERVVCIDVPRLHGEVVHCSDDGVRVRWDDGTDGDLVWNQSVAYNAYRLQVIKAEPADSLPRPASPALGAPLDLDMLAKGVRMLGVLPQEHPHANVYNEALDLAAVYLRSFIGREQYLPRMR